jgi:hypothetical protein
MTEDTVTVYVGSPRMMGDLQQETEKNWNSWWGDQYMKRYR